MKVMWLTNSPLTKVKNHINSSNIQFGGWLDGISAELLNREDITFKTISPFTCAEEKEGQVEKINYVVFPNSYKDDQMMAMFKTQIMSFAPDVIHIFGTEFKQTMLMLKVCESLSVLDKTVVSIQGLCSKYAYKYYSGLPNRVVNSWTLRDLLRHDNIKLQKKKFEERGKHEVEALKLTKNVIGRTDWDKACTTQANPDVRYYFCNETLRSEFYEDVWDYESCEKHSIFVSQCNYPIKGFHKLLEAMPIILSKYPDAKIYTTGKNLLNLSIKEKIKLGSYQKHLIDLIKKFNLQNHVEFLGSLSAEAMKKAYLNSNCFVSCSSIENSPNSVGEAMLLGVPTISRQSSCSKTLHT